MRLDTCFILLPATCLAPSSNDASMFPKALTTNRASSLWPHVPISSGHLSVSPPSIVGRNSACLCAAVHNGEKLRYARLSSTSTSAQKCSRIAAALDSRIEAGVTPSQLRTVKVAFGNDWSSASAAIPPCVVPVGNELVSCRSAVNRFERQLLDRANANSRPSPDVHRNSSRVCNRRVCGRNVVAYQLAVGPMSGHPRPTAFWCPSGP
jgi:hypothetical protein